MRLGVCYYPEQWPDDRVATDVAMMADLGLDVVRVGEFAWARLEPQRGTFDFGWLDRVVDAIADAGMSVMLGTPTAAPPIWLAREQPSILAVGPDGRRRPYGSRRHTCSTSAAYRAATRTIVTRLAERYGDHPAVTAWQVDNEPGNHESARCWCNECQAAFTAWLTDRYGTVDELNRRWGTIFWSQVYPTLADVRLPVPTTAPHSPSLLLAHRRFASDQAVSFLEEHYEILRRLSPGRELATNLYLFDLDVDAHAVANLGGISAFDSYPDGAASPVEVAYRLDFARGAGRAGAWVTEQQPGPINWTETNPPVEPGRLTSWVSEAADHGIDLLMYFRWRAARFGQEQYHSGLLRHDGRPARGFDEARHMRGAVAGRSRPADTVALLHSWDDAWALDIDPHAPRFSHGSALLAVYEGAVAAGHTVLVVSPECDLTRFPLVLAPYLHLHSPDRLSALRAAARAGSTVVVGPRSLVKDSDNAWWPGPYPADLVSEMAAEVDEYLALDRPVGVSEWGTVEEGWVDVLTPGADGEVLATFDDWFLAGRAAAVRNGPWVAMGCSGSASWAALLASLAEAERPDSR